MPEPQRRGCGAKRMAREFGSCPKTALRYPREKRRSGLRTGTVGAEATAKSAQGEWAIRCR